MFRLYQVGPTRSDEISPFKVIFDKEYTLKEFVENVLQNEREWGYFHFGDVVIEYRYGKLMLCDIPKEYEDKIISSAECDGGWSRMDYYLKFE